MLGFILFNMLFNEKKAHQKEVSIFLCHQNHLLKQQKSIIKNIIKTNNYAPN